MLSRFRARLTYANVIATVALFVALGGSSYAALKLPKASVGAKQLKKNSVTTVKVKPGSLLTSDFKASQRSRLRGPQGPQGVQGVPGQPGAAGSARAYAAVEADTNFPPTFFSGPHPGFTAVTRTDTGTYCVTAPGLSDEQLRAALVSVTSSGSPYFVAANLCTGGVEVVTRTAAGAEADNIDFNVLVP
jgi:hypothetical protein